jgi:NAD(P)-dependent dehydrogenase (short-subunit alcohol dehydrogenase family)
MREGWRLRYHSFVCYVASLSYLQSAVSARELGTRKRSSIITVPLRRPQITMHTPHKPVTRFALITGTSTGIGKAISLRLAAEGVNVFAGVRRSTDGEALITEASQLSAGSPRKGGRVMPVILDVTDNVSIQSAISQLREETGANGLWALINNAGVAIGGPVEEVSAADWKRQFDINLFGSIEVIRAALPLLRKGVQSHGINIPRLVLVSSIGGRVAQPFLAPYTCSKAAATALGDSLRLELRRQGIGVSVIEPGAIATPIWRKGEASLAEFGPNHPARNLYAEEIDGLRKTANQVASAAIPPERAAEAIFIALTAQRAPARVLIGQDAKIAALLKRWLPTGWFDFLLMRQFHIANLPMLEAVKAPPGSLRNE